METSEKFDLIFSEVAEMLSEVAECPVSDVKIDSDLPNELGINSLMGLEILVMIERKYKVKLKEEDLVKMTTPRIMVEMLLPHIQVAVA